MLVRLFKGMVGFVVGALIGWGAYRIFNIMYNGHCTPEGIWLVPLVMPAVVSAITGLLDKNGYGILRSLLYGLCTAAIIIAIGFVVGLFLALGFLNSVLLFIIFCLIGGAPVIGVWFIVGLVDC